MSEWMRNSEVNYKVENNIIIADHLDDMEVEGIGETLFKHFSLNGDALAQIDALTGQEETFHELFLKCIRTAIHMQKMGVKHGDVVSICSYNQLNLIVPFISTLFIGAQVSCTDPQLSISDTVHLLKQVHPKLIFISTNAVDLIENTVQQAGLNSKIIVFGETKKHIPFSHFLKPVDAEREFKPFHITNVNETSIITFSSGTTGAPKGICLSHYGLMRSILSREYDTGLRLMSPSSPYWISAVMFYLITVVTKGIRIVIPEFDRAKIWKWIKTYKVNAFYVSTAQWITLTKHGRPKDADTSTVIACMVGGSNISKNQMLDIRRLFPTSCVMNFYGMTELSGMGFSISPLSDPINLKIYNENPHSIGRLAKGCECKVVHVDTEEALGPHQTGELRIKSIFQMNGYYNMDSSDAWDSDGFLKTGDLVYYDEDFSFYFVDRQKEMLKYRSWQIAPVQLEVILLSHPFIINAVVLGMPDPEDGDHPMALIEVSQPISEEEVIKFLNTQVAETHKLRAGVKFTDKIPMSVTGKNRRMYLRDLIRQGLI